MERKLTPTQKAWVKYGYEHAKCIHQSMEIELNRKVSSEELENDSSIQDNDEIINACSEFPTRGCFESDEDYENANFDLTDDECYNLFSEGIEKYTDEVKKEETLGAVPSEFDNGLSNDKGYCVNINGEDVEVDVESDEEYSCLLNCLEGYYIYGIGREDED